MNNNVEGVYIDDLIVGFASRGEMVTNAGNNATFATNTEVLNPNKINTDRYVTTHSLVGQYQVEIRRTVDFAQPGDDPRASAVLGLTDTYDVNFRFANLTELAAAAGRDVAHGSYFTLYDGLRTVYFQFSETGATAAPTPPALGVSDTLVTILYSKTDSAGAMAVRIRDAINGAATQGTLRGIVASLAAGQTTGAAQGLTDNRVTITGTVVPTINTTGLGVTITRNLAYNENGDTFYYGDRNQYRPQGQLLLQDNQILYSSQWGITVETGLRDAAGRPAGGVPINFGAATNNEGLAPGVVISNNVIAFSGAGGIRLSGDTNLDPGGAILAAAAKPFHRVLNNTIYGGTTPVGTGILVEENTAATLLNNIVAGLNVGISVDGSSSGGLGGTVIGYTLFQSNNANGAVGSNSVQQAPTDPLFINPAVGNFYLRPNSGAIDASLDELGDRTSTAYYSTKIAAGIPDSRILAPSVDRFGQVRVDDPSKPNSGVGSSIPYADRGAVERADFTRPTFVITSQTDRTAAATDPATQDRDPRLTYLDFNDPTFDRFVFQLADIGVGIDDTTAVSSAFTLRRDGVVLVAGQDYLFNYNPNTKEVIFRPVGVKFPYGTYEVTVDNVTADDTVGSPSKAVADLAGQSAAREPGRRHARLHDRVGRAAAVHGRPGVGERGRRRLGGDGHVHRHGHGPHGDEPRRRRHHRRLRDPERDGDPGRRLHGPDGHAHRRRLPDGGRGRDRLPRRVRRRGHLLRPRDGADPRRHLSGRRRELHAQAVESGAEADPRQHAGRRHDRRRRRTADRLRRQRLGRPVDHGGRRRLVERVGTGVGPVHDLAREGPAAARGAERPDGRRHGDRRRRLRRPLRPGDPAGGARSRC